MSFALASAMSRTSSLNRIDDDNVPSWPAESTRTGIASLSTVAATVRFLSAYTYRKDPKRGESGALNPCFSTH
jgi:hypothetical protein